MANKLNLMLHAGADRCERGQLVTVPTPSATASWQPIPHSVLLDEVTGTLSRAGLSIVSEAHGVTRDGARYFGLLQVRNGHDDGNFGLVVGLRNSHDMSFPAAIALGAQVFVCDNLAFHGEIKLARKHTRFIMRDLPQLTERAVGRLTDLRCEQEERYLTYQRADMTDSAAHDVMIQALDSQVVPITKLPQVIQEWRDPRHPEFAPRNVWRLYNAFTEVLKGTALDILPRRTQALHGIMDLACGVFGDRFRAAQRQARAADIIEV